MKSIIPIPALSHYILPRGAKPAAAESAAHIHHVVTEHLAPAFSAAGRFLILS